MFYELKLQCASHSRAKIGRWEAQPAINKDKALPGRGLGRVIADSVISFSLLLQAHKSLGRWVTACWIRTRNREKQPSSSLAPRLSVNGDFGNIQVPRQTRCPNLCSSRAGRVGSKAQADGAQDASSTQGTSPLSISLTNLSGRTRSLLPPTFSSPAPLPPAQLQAYEEVSNLPNSAPRASVTCAHVQCVLSGVQEGSQWGCSTWTWETMSLSRWVSGWKNMCLGLPEASCLQCESSPGEKRLGCEKQQTVRENES